MTEASRARDLTAARHEHLVPGREIHMHDVRGQRFCEVGLITGTSQDSAVVNIWNTTGACDPSPEQFDALDAGAIASENGAMHAWLSPVRHWTPDHLDVWEAGDSRNFGSLTGTWMGAGEAAAITSAMAPGAYDPAYVYRGSTFTFSKGSQVYVLDAPDGEVFIMQSVAPVPALERGDESLAQLVSRLDLPDGWGFRVMTADEDLEVSSAGHDNLAHVMQDSLHNVYQGSDFGRAFSRLCPPDSQW